MNQYENKLLAHQGYPEAVFISPNIFSLKTPLPIKISRVLSCVSEYSCPREHYLHFQSIPRVVQAALGAEKSAREVFFWDKF